MHRKDGTEAAAWRWSCLSFSCTSSLLHIARYNSLSPSSPSLTFILHRSEGVHCYSQVVVFKQYRTRRSGVSRYRTSLPYRAFSSEMSKNRRKLKTPIQRPPKGKRPCCPILLPISRRLPPMCASCIKST